MSRNYWASVLDARMDRRKTLAATGALAAGEAFLAACGGSDSGGGGKVDTSLLTRPADTTKMASDHHGKRLGDSESTIDPSPGRFDGRRQCALAGEHARPGQEGRQHGRPVQEHRDRARRLAVRRGGAGDRKSVV